MKSTASGFLVLTVLLGALLTAPVFAGPLGISVNYAHQLELIDFINGPLHLYGQVNLVPGAVLESVAIHPFDGRIFAGDTASNLYLINLANPALSAPLGNLNIGAIEGLDFEDGSGELFAVSGSDLYWIDPNGPDVIQQISGVGGPAATSIAVQNTGLAYMTEFSGSFPTWNIWSVDPWLGGPLPHFSFSSTEQVRALDLASDGNYYGLAFTGFIYRFDMNLLTATTIFHNGMQDWSGVTAIDGTTLGACCFPNNPPDCAIVSPELCARLNGIYLGDNTDCSQPCVVAVEEGSWSAVKTMYR